MRDPRRLTFICESVRKNQPNEGKYMNPMVPMGLVGFMCIYIYVCVYLCKVNVNINVYIYMYTQGRPLTVINGVISPIHGQK